MVMSQDLAAAWQGSVPNRTARVASQVELAH